MEDHTDPRPDAVVNCVVSISILDIYPIDHGANTSSSVHGSPRHMAALAKNALMLVSEFGCPHVFLTLTCNPKLSSTNFYNCVFHNLEDFLFLYGNITK